MNESRSEDRKTDVFHNSALFCLDHNQDTVPSKTSVNVDQLDEKYNESGNIDHSDSVKSS